MYLRIVNLKFASEIEADAMKAYAEHELINKLLEFCQLKFSE